MQNLFTSKSTFNVINSSSVTKEYADHYMNLNRNLNPKMGLSNGTRLTVKALFDNAIDCEVSTGKSRGQRIYLPRFVITANAQPGSIAPLATTNCPLLCYVDNFLYESAMQ